jgi:membrane associated rhomboid family serine protease
MLLDLFGGFANTQGDNVAHWAHLGGALAGLIIVIIWNKTNRKTFY